MPNCISNYIKTILSCEYEKSFEAWLRRRNFIWHFHPKMAECRGQKASCKWNIDMRQLCQESDNRIAKTIRVRLGFVENLLNDTSINVKIVYLVRDPRAAAMSIKRMHWNHSPYRVCSHVHFDFSAYEYLKPRYPDKVFKVQYELLSLNPEEVASKMYRFLYGDNSLSEDIRSWLREHTETKAKGAMSEKRDSKAHYEEWRYSISEEMLLAIENELFCQKAFKQLGYNRFNSSVNVRDSSIPMIISKPIID